jgi:hypothetical protein
MVMRRQSAFATGAETTLSAEDHRKRPRPGGSPNEAEIEPLAVAPKVAWKLLSISNTHGYELLAKGLLDSFLVGRSRRITIRSIHNLVDRLVADQKRLPTKTQTQTGRAGDATELQD